MCVPGDGGSAEWAFGLALLSGLGDESLPPAPVGLAGCAVGVCHRVSDHLWPLWASHGLSSGLGTVGGMNTLPWPCRSILGAVLCV